MLLTIHQPGGPIEVEYPASPADFRNLLGRFCPEVPSDFNCAEVSPSLNTVVLSDTNRVTAEIHAVRLRPDNMTNLIRNLRGMFPQFFNQADIAAANAAYLDRN